MGEKKTIATRLSPQLLERIDNLIEKNNIRGRSEYLREAAEHYAYKLDPPRTKLEKKEEEIEKLEEELKETKIEREKILDKKEEIKNKTEEIKDDLKETLRDIVEERGFYDIYDSQTDFLVNTYLTDREGYKFNDTRKVRDIMLDYGENGSFNRHIDDFVGELDDKDLIDFESVVM